MVVTASAPPKAAPSAELAAEISSSAWNVRTPNFLCLASSCRMSEAGVIGYEPRKSGSLDSWPAAIEAVRERRVAGDVPVLARLDRGRLDLVADREVLGRLAVVPAGLERGHVGLVDLRLLAELRLEEGERALRGPSVQPGQQAEREHVLRPLGVLAGDVLVFKRLDGQRGQRHRMQLVPLERAVFERVLLIADLDQVALGELVGVDDQVHAPRQVLQVRLERRRVHRDENVGRVPRGENIVVREVQLEAGHAGQRALRCADLSGKVRQGGQVVAEDRGLLGEPVTGELHAITGVASEPDDYVV